MKINISSGQATILKNNVCVSSMDEEWIYYINKEDDSLCRISLDEEKTEILNKGYDSLDKVSNVLRYDGFPNLIIDNTLYYLEEEPFRLCTINLTTQEETFYPMNIPSNISYPIEDLPFYFLNDTAYCIMNLKDSEEQAIYRLSLNGEVDILAQGDYSACLLNVASNGSVYFLNAVNAKFGCCSLKSIFVLAKRQK